MVSSKLTIADLWQKKNRSEKIVMLTAYDFPSAVYFDESGIDIILVGDSVANVVLGLHSTREVDIAVMLHHARAVTRGVKHALVVGDMPYLSLQEGMAASLAHARRFIAEAGCDAVKVEWFDSLDGVRVPPSCPECRPDELGKEKGPRQEIVEMNSGFEGSDSQGDGNCVALVELLVKYGIPVMGHVGLTPQTAEALGGFKVQGKDAEAAARIFRQAKILADKGCFSLVLECIPDRLAGYITQQLEIPTIGIGAGVCCDGQVLVSHDVLGLYEGRRPKFVKPYAELGKAMKESVGRFREDVQTGRFPDAGHSYTMGDGEFEKFLETLK